MDTIKEKLRKVHALATEGLDGERAAAQVILDGLLDKYGLTLQDIADEARQEYVFKYHSSLERRLLLQIAVSVTQDGNTVIWSYRQKKQVGIELTKAELIEIRFLHREFIPLWREEQKAFMNAFCVKHNLLAPATEGQELSDEEVAERLRWSQMAAGLQDANLKRKRLGS